MAILFLAYFSTAYVCVAVLCLALAFVAVCVCEHVCLTRGCNCWMMHIRTCKFMLQTCVWAADRGRRRLTDRDKQPDRDRQRQKGCFGGNHTDTGPWAYIVQALVSYPPVRGHCDKELWATAFRSARPCMFQDDRVDYQWDKTRQRQTDKRTATQTDR